jgi:hypothetical protein
MRFTVTVLGRCTGGNHLHLRLTHPVSGVTREITLGREDLTDTDATLEEREAAATARVVSQLKEAGLSASPTLNQIRTALEGREYRV